MLGKIQLTQDGNDDTYEEDRIIYIAHPERPYSQKATVLLTNADKAVTANYKGYKGVISYGMTTDSGAEYSACAPLWVLEQEYHSSEGVLTVALKLEGTLDFVATDKANTEHEPDQQEIKTPKYIINELLAGIPIWVLNTAYSLKDPIKPTSSNGFVYKCTTAGTSDGSEPTWGTSVGGTTSDGSVTWTNVGKEITAYSHCLNYTVTWDSEDAVVDVLFVADFYRIALNESRLDIVKQILQFTRMSLRAEADEAIHLFVPTVVGDTWVADTVYFLNDYVQPTSPNNNFTYKATAIAGAGKSHATTEPTWPTVAGNTVVDNEVTWTAIGFDYEYSLASGEHDFFAKTFQHKLVVPNERTIKTPRGYATPYTGTATFSEDKDLIDKRDYEYLRVTSDAQAESVALAKLVRARLDAQTGSGWAPMNVGAEVFDFIKITDSRESQNRLGTMGYLERFYRPGEYRIRFGLGEPKLGGLWGLLWSPLELQIGELQAELTEEEQAALPATVGSVNKAFSSFGDQANENFINIESEINSLWDELDKKTEQHQFANLETVVRDLITIRGEAPELRWEETDQADPAGRWRVRVDGDVWYLEAATAVDWGSDVDIFTIPKAAGGTTIFKLPVDDGTLEIFASTGSGKGAHLVMRGEGEAGAGMDLATDNGSSSAVLRISFEKGAALVTMTITGIDEALWNTAGVAHDVVAGSSSGSSKRFWDYRMRVSGAPSAGWGQLFRHYMKTSTTNDVLAAQLEIIWTTATHATRVSDMIFSIEDGTSRGTMQNYLRLDGSAKVVEVTKVIRGATSLWWHSTRISPFSADPGASGATWVDPTTNRVGGYQLNASGEHLHFHTHVEDDWDGASDLEVHVVFEINVDNSGGSGTDTVDLQLIMVYKGDGEAVTKTQTLEVAKVVGTAGQYTQFETEFTIDYDLANNVVVADDTFGFTVNLETDTSEVNDITINLIEFKYKSAKIRMEV